jgi:hypothetical protein
MECLGWPSQSSAAQRKCSCKKALRLQGNELSLQNRTPKITRYPATDYHARRWQSMPCQEQVSSDLLLVLLGGRPWLRVSLPFSTPPLIINPHVIMSQRPYPAARPNLTHHQPATTYHWRSLQRKTRSFAAFCRAYSECGFAVSRRLFRIYQGHWTTAGGLTRRRPQGCQLPLCTVPPPLCPRLPPKTRPLLQVLLSVGVFRCAPCANLSRPQTAPPVRSPDLTTLPPRPAPEATAVPCNVLLRHPPIL